MRCRRSDTAGGTFFFTVNLANRSSRLLTVHINLLRDSVRKVRHAHPLRDCGDGGPDHVHAIWTLPSRDRDYPLRGSLIKAGFSRLLDKTDPVSEIRRRKRERGIWQRRYWEHQLRDEADLARHVDYIHSNPVKHGHVATPVAWRYSSIHRYIRHGIVPVDWAVDLHESESGFGE